MADFDINTAAYQRLLTTLQLSGLVIYTGGGYIAQKEHPKSVILRSNVDRNIRRTLRLAKLENSLGISLTYYFWVPKIFNPKIIRFISNLGHEFGYHY